MIVNILDEFSKESLAIHSAHAKTLGRKIGLTSGCYDLFHLYHLTYLERCFRHLKENGSTGAILVVGVDSDCLVKSVKGDDRPIFSEQHRLKLLDACRYVCVSFIMNSVKDHEDMVNLIKPDFVFKNQDIDPTEVYVGDGQLMVIPDIEELLSTTQFINKIKDIAVREMKG